MKFETSPPKNRTITVADGQRTGIYRGTVVDLGLETARLPNGELLSLEIVRHPGGAAILALDQQNRVCLLRQYRHSIGKWIWELPAGVIEKGEQPNGNCVRKRDWKPMNGNPCSRYCQHQDFAMKSFSSTGLGTSGPWGQPPTPMNKSRCTGNHWRKF